MEAWYLQCLVTWTGHYGRPPSIYELSAWVHKSRTSVYAALCALEAKGYLRRSDDRKFEVIS